MPATHLPESAEDGSQPDIELRRIVDLTPQMLAVMEPDGHISWLNQVALDYLGISLADLSGRDVGALVIHPDDLQPFRDTRQHALAAAVPYNSELRVRGTNGTYRWFFMRYTPLTDAAQRVVRWYGGAIDIEDRKRAETARRRSEAYLAEAQRLTHTGSWAVDYRALRAVYWSEETFRVHGFNLRQSLPTREEYERLVHPDDQGRVSRLVDTAFLENTDFAAEYRLVLRDGTQKHVQLVGHPVFAATGEAIEYVGTVVDVTDRTRAEQARKRAAAELQQARSALARRQRVSILGEVAASLAHEIKQPIAAARIDAKVGLRALADDRLDLETARAAASRLVKALAWANEIVKRTTALYKKDTTERERVDVNGVIREMAALLQQEASASSISIRTELAEGLPHLTADRVQLQQVLMNLMLNAIEAMTEAGGELILKSELTDDRQLLVSVSDTGMGLPVDRVDDIFNAFVTTKPQGTGMGLSISRSIIDVHDGRLWVDRHPGPGATFRFTLPLRSNGPDGST